jgi:hypothetical protein
MRDTLRWIQMIPMMENAEYQTDIVDEGEGEGEGEGPKLPLRLRKSPADGLLMIGAEGYGEKTAEDGDGFPIVIEFYDHQWRLMVWGDINSEDPTHVISLEGAREDARES